MQARYFPLLDSLRGIAALGVFVLHIAFVLGLGTGTGVADYLVEHVSNYPAPSVAIFFALSGFVLYRPFVARRLARLEAEPLGEYAVRRAVRILPAYWVALIVTALVLHYHDVFTGLGLLHYFAFTQVYDQNYFAGGNPVSWSLDVDVAFYALLPVVALFLARLPARTRRRFLVSELGACLALYALSTAWQAAAVLLFQHHLRWFFPAELSLPGSLDFMAGGMALAVLSVWFGDGRGWRPLRVLGRHSWLPWLVALGAYVLIGQFPAGFASRHHVLAWELIKQLRLVLAVSALVPLVFGTANGGLLRRALASRPARLLGSISYGFYLWQWVVIEGLLEHHVRADLGDVAFTVVALGLTALLATASWYGLERPLGRYVRRRLAARAGTHEPPPVVEAAATVVPPSTV